MSMPKHPGNLPRPAADLERLAGYYETHDTSAEMEHGEWVEPRPMATTSLRLPAGVIATCMWRPGKVGAGFRPLVVWCCRWRAHGGVLVRTGR
jgi:hypothetical protein